MNQNTYRAEMPSRNLDIVYHLDANRINAKQLDANTNQLEEWHQSKIIFLEMSGTAYDEAGCGNGWDSEIRREKSDDYTFVSSNDSLGVDGEWRRLIEQVIFPSGAKELNEKNDISVLLDA